MGNNCLSCLKNLKEVVLHGQNITIGENCFAKCESFKSLTIKEPLSPYESCFSRSQILQKVSPHSKNIIIDEDYFSECDSLNSFTMTELEENNF